jgi:D-3-phosphoglycerate dehydrogenase
MPRVIVLDDLAEEGLRLLQAEAGFDVVVQTGLKGDALRDALRDFDGAICRSGVKITADCLSGNQRLQAIVRAGVGTDNIDKAAATRSGVIVMNTPAGNTVSTAEHTFALLLGLARNLAPANASLVAGKWDRKNFEGVELRGKQLGIIGLGRIGLRVARLARAFEMRVCGLDPFLPRERAAELDFHRPRSITSSIGTPRM